MKALRACPAFTAAWFLVTAVPQPQLLAQAPQQQERPKTLEPVTGELLSLNPDTKTLVIRTTGDAEMKFSYSEETEIVGAEKGASGLATGKGATVTVTYDVHGTANVATKIEVKQQ